LGFAPFLKGFTLIAEGFSLRKNKKRKLKFALRGKWDASSCFFS
jgi:hypothetical protein